MKLMLGGRIICEPARMRAYKAIASCRNVPLDEKTLRALYISLMHSYRDEQTDATCHFGDETKECEASR